MTEQHSQIFDIYIETFGKVLTGAQLTTGDFGSRAPSATHIVPYSLAGKIAVTLAAEDAKAGRAPRPRSEVEADVAAMQK